MINNSGSIFLYLSLTVFFVSLAAAGFVAWRLSSETWFSLFSSQSANQAELTTSDAPSEPILAADPLMPDINIAPSLIGQEATLNRQLITPLRLYYATRTDHLKSITVEPSTNNEYAALVTLQLATNNNAASVIFLYGSSQDEEIDFPAWEPGLLDDNP